jgi:hypothetical protein
MKTWIVMLVATWWIKRCIDLLEAYPMWPHQDRMWCLVYACVLDSKPPKRILRYLKHTQNVGLWYPREARFELIGYLNSDYVGCKVERKSTSGTCQLLGRSLVSWSSKKQNSVALSTAEAEYISAGSCCAQLLWMKATLSDFEIKFK